LREKKMRIPYTAVWEIAAAHGTTRANVMFAKKQHWVWVVPAAEVGL
jgi:hypothetical protein